MFDIDKLYYIMDYSGNYYRTNDRNELVVARSVNEATEYSFIDANKRISNGHKSRFYVVIPVEEDKTDEYQVQEEPGEIVECETGYDLSQLDWKEYLIRFVEITGELKAYKESLIKAESDVDLKICDILHYIELCETTDDEAMQLVELLKQCREHRRDVKDEIICLDVFQRTVGNGENVAKAKEAIKAIKGLDNRKYNPRKLNELFENRVVNFATSGKKSYKNTVILKSEPIDDIVDRKENEHMELVRKNTIFDGKDNDWMAFAMQQAEFYRNANQYIINLQLDIEDIDEEILDLMEEIDTSNCNVAQGYKLFKKLKELRIKRKEKEKELKCLNMLTGHFDMNEMANECESTANDLEKFLYPEEIEQEEVEDADDGIISMVV